MTASSGATVGRPSALSGVPTTLALTRIETVAGLRSTGLKLLVLAMAVVGWSVGSAPGRGVGLSAYAAGTAAWQFGGFLAILVMSLAAIRESLMRTEMLVYSKPQPTERLVLARFIATYGQIILGLAALFAAAAASRAAGGGSLAGATAYVQQFARASCVVFFASAAAYTMALLANNALAGALVALFWILTTAGRAYLPKPFFPAYTQNQLFFMLLGMTLLGLALLFHRRARRGSARPSLPVRLMAPGMFAASILVLAATVRNGHDPQLLSHPAMDAMSSQNIVVGERAPGFQLPDQKGRVIGLADFRDRILLIGLFTPGDAQSTAVLEKLQTMAEKYGARGVQPIAVCLSQDLGAADTFAMGEHLGYPVVTDWGAHNSDSTQDMSPIATAYLASTLPRVVVTDRRRRVVVAFSGIAAYDGPDLEEAVKERLNQEPE